MSLPMRGKIRVRFSTIHNERSRQEAVNAISASLQTKDGEVVEVPLPNSMHTGQIILLTKLMTATDLRFYDFEAGAPVERWRSGAS